MSRALSQAIVPLALLVATAVPACGDGGAAATTSSNTGAGGAATSTFTGSGGAAAGGGGQGGGCVAAGPATSTFVPGPADIQFAAKNPLPQGEQILFNDWNPSPNTLSSVTPDGASTTTIFTAFRVWSMGVSHSAGTIAFASGDPAQEAHWGIQIYDAIQNTFLYDVATQTATLLAPGNVNDECHTFGPGDASLFVCRRYDFTVCGDDHGYRLARVDLGTKALTFLSPDDQTDMGLDPQPLADGATMLFTSLKLVSSSYERAIERMTLASGARTVLRADAGGLSVSPDGTRYAYADYTDQGRLWVSALDGTGPVRVAPVAGTSAAWSPDGTKIAYLAPDASDPCSHIDVVASDGSTADGPTRIRDCTVTKEFITQLAWISKP